VISGKFYVIWQNQISITATGSTSYHFLPAKALPGLNCHRRILHATGQADLRRRMVYLWVFRVRCFVHNPSCQLKLTADCRSTLLEDLSHIYKTGHRFLARQQRGKTAETICPILARIAYSIVSQKGYSPSQHIPTCTPTKSGYKSKWSWRQRQTKMKRLPCLHLKLRTSQPPIHPSKAL
jgi:hypothetical protein